MEVILLERVGKLGKMGDVVRVKDGYARNFLLPRNKALRANADNKARFESMKAELETQSLERKGEAGKIAAKVDGKQFTIIRQSSETGQLYGSVTSRDIATLISTDGLTISRAQVELNAPIKALGLYKVALGLLCDLYALSTIEAGRGWWMEHGRLSSARSKAITSEVDGLCRRIRPIARELVDGFGVPEEMQATEMLEG